MFDGGSLREQQLQAFRTDVLAGLSGHPKAVPSRWLYDERGSELFEAITGLDEYRLTRTEVEILRTHGKEIGEFCGDSEVLLEYGAGAGVKSELLIEALRDLQAYVPVDIAGDCLEQTSARLSRRFPSLRVDPLVADFTGAFALPGGIDGGSRLGFFPGSTIGNLDGEESRALLRRLGEQVGTNGRAIVGVDTEKAPEILLPAYDDKLGVTAAFNANLLMRINRELDGDFVLERFRHEARWNARDSAVEMHLRSLAAQTVTVSGHVFGIAAGETIHTESSRKYTIAEFARLARDGGWRTDRTWSDERGSFAVFGLARS